MKEQRRVQQNIVISKHLILALGVINVTLIFSYVTESVRHSVVNSAYDTDYFTGTGQLWIEFMYFTLDSLVGDLL